MKLTIILAVISLLSMAECNSCKPSYFSTKYECKKCFCSGVSSQCRGSSFFIKKILGDLDDIQSILKIAKEGASINSTHRFEAVTHIPKGLTDFTVQWILPVDFYVNGLRSYGGRIRLIQNITAPTFGMVDDIIIVSLRSDETELMYEAQPQSSSGYRFVYDIPLAEEPWKVVSKGNAPATRDDMMIVLAKLKEIEVFAPLVSDMETVSIEEVSMYLAADDREKPLDLFRTDLIEICECPEGYRGESCEKCSCGYYRDRYRESESLFGACVRCPCYRDDKDCIMDNCVTDEFEISSDCDMI